MMVFQREQMEKKKSRVYILNVSLFTTDQTCLFLIEFKMHVKHICSRFCVIVIRTLVIFQVVLTSLMSMRVVKHAVIFDCYKWQG